MNDAEMSTCPTLLRSLGGSADAAAWRVFVERYTPLIDERCRNARLQSADCDDVRQQVFAQLVKALIGFRYDPARRFRGYLSQTVDNAIRTRWRLARRSGVIGLGDRDVPEPLAALPAELDDLIRNSLQSVSRTVEKVRFVVGPEAWAAFWLTAIDGLSGEEAGARLGKQPSAVYMSKSRVLAKLRTAVGMAPEVEPRGATEDGPP